MEQKFVTLPREVVERAIEALRGSETPTYRAQYDIEIDALVDLSAALDQPQNHVPDAGNMVQAGWRLVPVTPTPEMIRVMCAYDGTQYSNTFDSDDFKEDYRNMLAAAPQPPAVEQPQANQPAMTPIAQRKLDSMLTEGYTISGYSVYHERKHQHGFVTGAGLVGWWKPEGVEYPQQQGEQEPVAGVVIDGSWNIPSLVIIGSEDSHIKKFGGNRLYTHPQPKRHPLTDEQISRLWSDAHNDTTDRMAFQVLARAIEAAHDIK